MQKDTSVEMTIAYQQLQQRLSSYLALFKSLRDFSNSQFMNILAGADSHLRTLCKYLQAIGE